MDAQVLEISPERCRVALSLKRLLPNPWEKADTDFAVGQIVSAVITSIVSYGAFARLEAGVEGLIHASEMLLEGDKSVRDVVSEKQEVQVRILHVDAAHQRMGLSLNLDGADA
jgi:small subunit ribosomal protein S1